MPQYRDIHQCACNCKKKNSKKRQSLIDRELRRLRGEE